MSKMIMLVSIISVVFLITTPIGITLGADETIEQLNGEIQPPENDMPIGDLIWFDIEGDSAPTLPTAGGEDGNCYLPSAPPSVDKVFISANRVIEREAFIDTILPLNVVGYVEINVLDGSENLKINPYFERIDAADEILLGIIASIVYATAGAVSIIYKAIGNMNLAVAAAIAVGCSILTVAATIIAGGAVAITLSMIAEVLTQFGLGNLVQEIYEFVVGAASLIIGTLVVLATKYLEWMFPEGNGGGGNGSGWEWIINLFTGFKAALQQCGQVLKEGPFVATAIIMAIRGADYDAIYTYLVEEAGLGQTKANLLATLLIGIQSDILNDLRANTFGKFALFASFGDKVSLDNLHIEIGDSCIPSENEYAAIMKVKSYSANNEFDTTTIGIIYNGEAPSEPSSTQQTMPTSTVSGTTMGDTATSEPMGTGTVVGLR